MKIQSTASSKALTVASLLRSGSKSEVTQQPSVAEDHFEPSASDSGLGRALRPTRKKVSTGLSVAAAGSVLVGGTVLAGQLLGPGAAFLGSLAVSTAAGILYSHHQGEDVKAGALKGFALGVYTNSAVSSASVFQNPNLVLGATVAGAGGVGYLLA